jgi:hypothetical protein
MRRTPRSSKRTTRFGRGASQHTAQTHSARYRRLLCEALEDRRLLSADLALATVNLQADLSSEVQEVGAPASALAAATYGVTINTCTISTTSPSAGQAVTLSGTTGQVHGSTSSEQIKVVIGFRDSAGKWAGGDPVVVSSTVPGTSFQPWTGIMATVNAPSSAGTYHVWVRDVATTDSTAAIQDFKNSTATTADEVRDDEWGTAVTVTGYGVSLSSCTISSTTPSAGQAVTLAGTSGQVRGMTSSDTMKIVIGFRDSAGNWAGGDPVVVSSTVPGTTFKPWSGISATVNAPSNAGTYRVWVRDVATTDNATAIQDFKTATPTSADEVRDDDWGTSVTVTNYGVTFNSCTISNTSPNAGQAVTLSNTSGQVHGLSSSDQVKVVIGFRDSTGKWAGGDPVVISSTIPGTTFQTWQGISATINAPATAGTYRVWVRDVGTSDNATAIQDFKNATPASPDEVRDDMWNSPVTVMSYGVTFSACTISNTSPAAGQAVTLSGTNGQIRGMTSSDTMKVVIGFRDSTGKWAGGDPVVISTSIPGQTFQQWWGTSATINAPADAGTYHVWIRDVATADDATAIQDFKTAIPTSSDEVRDDEWGTAVTVITYGVTFNSCTISNTTPAAGQPVTLSGTTGQVHGVSSSEQVKLVIGFRDSAGNWTGGDPVVISSTVPGTTFQPWQGINATINAPANAGTYHVWIRDVGTTDNATAIQDFKTATPTSANETRDDRWGTTVTVTTYGLTLDACTIGNTTPSAGQAVLLSATSGQIHGVNNSDQIKIVIGFRDSAGNWAGGDPVVISSTVPGPTFQQWWGANATINAPSEAGSYYVWVRDVANADDAAAIQDFKTAVPTSADEVRDDRWGSAVAVTSYGLVLSSCTISNTTPDASQAVTLSSLSGQVHGLSNFDPVKVVIGFRDAAGNWVGSEPVVIATIIPGPNFQPWWSDGATLSAPSKAGTYHVWVRDVGTTDDATAIQDFKNATPTSSNEIRDDRWGTALTVTASLPTPPSRIGLYDPQSSTFYLKLNNSTGTADLTFGLGSPNGNYAVLAGDWDGDGASGVGLYDRDTSFFHLTNGADDGYAEIVFGFGTPGQGWIPMVGDWNGDGRTSVGLYDPNASTFYLCDNLQTGYADYTFGYGEPGGGWTPLVGDWNGKGSTGVGLYDPHASTFYLTNALQSGYAQYTFGYGEPNAGWLPMVGDWDGNRSDEVGLFAPQSSTFYLTNAFVSGYAKYTFGYGEPNAGWQPLVGDWNGDGASGVGLYDPHASTFYLTDTLTSGYAQYTIGYGEPNAGWQPLEGSWAAPPTSSVSSLAAESAASLPVQPTATAAAPSPAAVDQIDLVNVAADLDGSSNTTDLDAAATGRLNSLAVDLALQSLA